MKCIIVLLVLTVFVSGLCAQDFEYNRWRMEYEQTKVNLQTATAIGITGVLFSVSGLVGTLADPKEVPTGLFTTEKRPRTEYLILSLAGTFTGAIGFVLASRAQAKLKSLKQIGLERGYILASFRPEYKGVSITLSFSF